MTEQKVLAHNLTAEQLQEIKYNQMHGTVEMVPANVELTHEIPAHEAHCFHVRQEMREYSRTTGDKLSSPRVQVYTQDDWKVVKESRVLEGYTVEILHNPILGQEVVSPKKKKEEKTDK
jgi:hypothetical protein